MALHRSVSSASCCGSLSGWQAAARWSSSACSAAPGRRLRWRGLAGVPVAGVAAGVRGRPGRGRGPGCRAAGCGAPPLFGFGAGQSLEERFGRWRRLQQLQFGDVPIDARQALYSRGASCCWRAPLFQGDGRFVGLQALGEFALGFAEAFLGGSAGGGRRSPGREGFRVVAEGAGQPALAGFAGVPRRRHRPGVEGLGAGRWLFPGRRCCWRVSAAWRMARSSRSVRSRGISLSIFTCRLHVQPAFLFEQGVQAGAAGVGGGASASLSWASRLAWF